MPNSETGIKLRKLDKNNKYDISMLFDWHEEHVALNFPTQKPHFSTFFLDLMNGTGQKLLFELQGEPVGFLWIDTKDNKYESKKEGIIRYIQVNKKYRGQGYGKMMMKKAESLLKDCAFITLGTYAKNEQSRVFYEKLGYQLTRVIYRKDL